MSYTPTTLGYAILGLLFQQPATGYGLRKTFETTPIGNYSSGPGTIYPALKRLKDEGLIEQFEPDKESAMQYRLTAEGRQILKQWCEKPLAGEDMARKSHELILRFAFMDQLADLETSIRFLESFKKEVDAYILKLSIYHENMKSRASLHGALAIEQGIAQYQSMSEWARNALQTVLNEARKPTQDGE
jgi:DNA-binding PadR family transcriptional regulator